MNPCSPRTLRRLRPWIHLSMMPVAAVGRFVRTQWDELRHAAAVIGTVIMSGVQPRHWVDPVRKALARQFFSIGVEPLWFVCALAVFVGMSVVVQLSFWIGAAGQSQLLGPILVTVVARELGPVLINLVVIVRSGSVMTNELAILQIEGDVRSLEKEGRDPLLHLVMPRVLGMAVATFCLTIVFILLAFASGFLFAAWMGKGSRDVFLFADTLSRAVQPKDLFNLLAKGILPALFAGACCCIGGLGAGGSFAGLPTVTRRALTRSVAGLLVLSAVVSVLTYL